MALQILESNIFFVDTSVFLRFLTKDNALKAANCKRLFERAAKGEVSLTTSESVIVELVQALSSSELYALQPQEIRQRLHPLISLQGLKLENKEKYLLALDLYCNLQLSFQQALVVAEVEQRGLAGLYSYSRRLDALEGVRVDRREP